MKIIIGLLLILPFWAGAQNTEKENENLLIGTWKILHTSVDCPNLDSDLILFENDFFNSKDSIITFFEDGTFATNGGILKHPFLFGKSQLVTNYSRRHSSYKYYYNLSLNKKDFLFSIYKNGKIGISWSKNDYNFSYTLEK
jgi:hypothetical protein